MHNQPHNAINASALFLSFNYHCQLVSDSQHFNPIIFYPLSLKFLMETEYFYNFSTNTAQTRTCTLSPRGGDAV